MKSTEITALLVAASLMVGGTYAWSAYSQKITNETIDGTKDAGGRLHDDFDGTNKDVYVENYMEPGENLYTRLRIREYFEYGDEVGDLSGANSGSVDLLRGDKQVDATPSISDETTWDIYLYGSTPTQGIDTIRTFRDLEFGGSTVYMPTFNQDHTDLKGDVNGTLGGLLGAGRDDANESYTDYQMYNVGDTKDGLLITEDDKVGTNATHTAKETLDSTIMTMAEWVDAGANAGNYWVFDVDGWAYWAQPLESDTATGLLLDEIIVKGNTDQRWYYAVEVEAQIATAGDWGDDSLETGMYGDITNDGLGLLNKISGLLKVSSLIVTNGEETIPNTTFNLPYLDSLNLIPKLTVDYGTGAAYETEVEWSIKKVNGDSNTVLDTNIFDEGDFNPVEAMIGSTYEITVTSLLTPSRTITYTITIVDIPEAIEIVPEDDLVDVRNTETLQLYAYELGTTIPFPVTWSIVEKTGSSGLTQAQISACLDDKGFFTADPSMAGCTYTVTATTDYPSIAPATKVISVYDDNSISLTVSSTGNISTMTLSPTNYELQMIKTITGLIDQSVTWTITENGSNSGLSQNSLNACIDENGLFSPIDAMAGGSYTITATSKINTNISGDMIISITAPMINVYTLDDTDCLDHGDEIQYQVTVVGVKDQTITWSLGSTEKANIDSNGKLTLKSAVSIVGDIDIIATLTSNTNAKGELTLVVGYRIPGTIYADLEGIAGTTTVVKSRNENGVDIEYYVLDTGTVTRRSTSGASQGDVSAVLLFATDNVTVGGSAVSAYHSSANDETWHTSKMNTTTLPTWLAEQTHLVDRVVRVSITTDGYYKTTDGISSGDISPVTTYSEAWLLSEPEFINHVGEYDIRSKASDYYWLRSPHAFTEVVDINPDGEIGRNWDLTSKYGVRPALWVIP